VEIPKGKQVLTSACGAHLIQDGLVALQYVLLPILAQQFGLSYAQVGLVRGVSNSAMTLLEIPSGVLAERMGERRLLAMGLLGAGVGYIGVALSSTFFGITLGFLIAGIGAAFQHSLSSSILVSAFSAGERRRALGTYNAFGDVGKLTYTGLFSAAVGAGIAWHGIVIFLSLVSVGFGIIVWKLIRNQGFDAKSEDKDASVSSSLDLSPSGWGIKHRRRFWTLGAIVFLDSVVQAVFLTFLVFVLKHKGAENAVAAMGVVIVLAGGMVGKYACGFIAARMGDRKAFVIIQSLTIAGVFALLFLSATQLLFMLPIIGMVVQGSSTITYGSVADYLNPDRQARGYALIYSLANSSSVAGPIVFGLIADHFGLMDAIAVLIVLLLATILLAFMSIQPAEKSAGTINIHI